MKSTVHRCHPTVIPAFVSFWLLLVMGSISGCGSVPGAQSSGDNSPGGDNDPDLLPATVVEDEDPGEYVIVASKTDIGENAFVFSVESKRGVVDEWTWEWDFGDGEARAGTDQVYSFTEPGSYLVQATAYDIRGRVAVVLTLELNVEETNAQPTANAGENQTVDAGALVFLYGGASFDPDDESLTYEWAQTSGVPVNLLDAHAVTASFVAPRLDEDIVLEFSLTVGDGELTSQDFITVFVEGMIDIASTGPVADAGSDQVVLEGTTVTLNGSGSSAFGDTPLTFEWTQFAGPPVALNGRTEAVATFVAPSAFGGQVELSFELLVNEGVLSAFDEVTVVVTSSGPPDDDGGDTGSDECPDDPNKTEPGVCGCGVLDVDTDSDGTANCVDGCPSDPEKTNPGDCGCGVEDADSDGDGTADCLDACPSGDDSDSDGDGILDCHDGCPNDGAKTAPGVCGCGVADTDGDSDGTPDCHDGCPDDANKVEPGICGCGVSDGDRDGDGTPDCEDGCPDDPQKTAAGSCGCGISDKDSDGDGVPDCLDRCPGEPDVDFDGDGVLNCEDGCPSDPNKTAPGACGCGEVDVDSDGDGSADCVDDCPDDPFKVTPGSCGCSVPETDTDGDTVPDCSDQCPNDPFKLGPGVCGCGVSDDDSDGDTVADCHDDCPTDPNKTEPGVCGCGTGDQDSDGDGVADCDDQCPGAPDVDSDGDGTLNCDDDCPLDPFKVNPGECGCGVSDEDSDGDGVPDCDDECPAGQDVDTDDDGVLDCHDGCPTDPNKTSPGVCGCHVSDVDGDGDGVANCNDQCAGEPDVDSDSDGVLDCDDGCPQDVDKVDPGVCGCGVSDVDSDGDGTYDCNDLCPNDEFKTSPGQCGCGVRDFDSDSDGTANCNDACPFDSGKVTPGACGCGVSDADFDGDGMPNCHDGCPNDPGKTQPGICGCGTGDVDSDGDGVPDCNDQCPGQPDLDFDGDGALNCDDACPVDPDKVTPGVCGCGVADDDTDDDGVEDCNDDCRFDPNKTEPGVCGCGAADVDSDGDGAYDCEDVCPGHDDDVDSDGDGIPDGCDTPAGGALVEDFDGYSVGSDPVDWMDTAADNSMSENDALFAVFSVGGNAALGTTSTAYNIHSHYMGEDVTSGPSFTLTGRMRLSDVNGGVGVTFLSSYPSADTYYRLRRFSGYGGDAFQISPHGTSITGGTAVSGVEPLANIWYRFNVEVEDTGSRTEIRAKVWQEGTSEPGSWQIDCYDDSATRLTSGTIGVWSMATGIKYWDDLAVSAANCDVDSDSDGTGDCVDQCVGDPNKIEPGVCGCGVADADSDSDGAPDCVDQCPGAPDLDSDGDGTADCDDGCPGDPEKTEAGACGCGVSDVDSDGDGTPDCQEPPSLCVSPTSLSFGSAATSLGFEVWNCGAGSLDYTVGGDASWLSVSPSSGESSGEHDTIIATVDRTGLPDDTYHAEITVNPSVGTAITAVVTMTVGASGALPAPVIVASRTEGPAPLAVFFEGTASEDGEGKSIENAGMLGTALSEYVWTFERHLGGTTYAVEGTSHGFNAAHVFEPPGSTGPNGEPTGVGATYRVTLNVTDRDGHVSSASRSITVQPFSGTTYYVRSDGNDGNSGTGPSAGQAWKTYNKAFVAADQMLSAGDRVLFKRGDTFTYSSAVVLSGNIGVLLGAYGTGSDPKIQYTGSGSGSSAAPINTNSATTVSFADLHFNCSGGGLADGFTVGTSRDVLLLRVTIENYDSADAVSYPLGVNNTNKMFVVESTLKNAGVTNFFYSGSRLAVLNSEIGPAMGSHNLYGSVIDRAVIQGTYFHDPEDSRTNMRIGANHETSRNIVVSGNEFAGGGTWLSIHLGITSGSWDLSQHCENLLMEDNTIGGASGLILLNSDYRDTIIRRNTFAGGSAMQVAGGNQIPDGSGYDGPRGLWFYENTITNGGGSWFSDTAPSSIDVYVWSNTVNGTLVPGSSPP